MVSESNQRTLKANPIIIGLYGLPGSGKSTIIKNLQNLPNLKNIIFLEGSDLLNRSVPGGLDVFHRMNGDEKVQARERAIEKAYNICAQEGKVGVVTGHYMFWDAENNGGQSVWTRGDSKTFSHILYLDVPVDEIARRQHNDTTRKRPHISTPDLLAWQQIEKTNLRSICFTNDILFSTLPFSPNMEAVVAPFLEDFGLDTEKRNLDLAIQVLDQHVSTILGPVKTVLAMDADRTLTAQDTGTLMWNSIRSQGRLPRLVPTMINQVFSSPLGYSYKAFRQAALICAEAFEEKEFDAKCKQAAMAVDLYPEFLSLIRFINHNPDVGGVIITCGQEQLWKRVLESQALTERVSVIGSGRGSGALVITPEVKAALVAHLQDSHGMDVVAFGDSPLDLPMLKEASEAIVVVGDDKTRSKSMDEALAKAIGQDGLCARQAIVSAGGTPRLDTTRLPLVDLQDDNFIQSIPIRPRLQLIHSTDTNSAKLLMTPMRDASVTGPALRAAHRSVGQRLAIEHLVDVIGLEEHSIDHVQGHETSGFQLLDEEFTVIVALMRGGEPMALGVNEVFPSAMLLHAKHPSDIQPSHINGNKTVILVDSVINSGKSVIEFLRRIHDLNRNIRTVVVAGVVNKKSIPRLEHVNSLIRRTLSVVALRLSENSFTGKGTTDTGNRLFNTTHLD